MIRLCAFSDEAGTSLQAQINALHRNGIRLMEIRTVDGENISNITLDRAQQIAAILKENDIQVWSIGSPLGKVSLDAPFDPSDCMELTHHLCRLANIFKAERIRMFSFYDSHDKKDLVFCYLRQMQQIAAGYGITLCHENEKGIYGDTVARVWELMENVPGMKYIYDPANYLQCGEPAADSLPALHSSTEYFHIKDVIAQTQELVPAGYGDGHIPELIKMVHGDTVMTLEPHLMVFDGYARIDKEAMKNRFHFSSNSEAFDAAVNALKGLLAEQGYIETNGGYEKQ